MTKRIIIDRLTKGFLIEYAEWSELGRRGQGSQIACSTWAEVLAELEQVFLGASVDISAGEVRRAKVDADRHQEFEALMARAKQGEAVTWPDWLPKEFPPFPEPPASTLAS